MIELDSTRMKDGTVISIFQVDEDKYVVAQFDRSDITVWESEFDDKDEAFTEYYKRTENA